MASLPNSKTDGELTTFKPEGGDDEPGYVANWGNYAAMSPTQALVSKKPGGGLKLSGLAATVGAIAIVNWVYGGMPFPIAFFPAFTVPWWALGWGFSIGAGTGLLGSFLPAWHARSVKVSEVFAKVA